MGENVNKNLDVEMVATSKNENQILDENTSQTLGKTEQRKENLEEVNIEKAQKEFKNFVKLHKEEIERIKKGNVKTLKCMGF